MTVKQLGEFKAEIIALAGMVTAIVGMVTEHEVAGILASTPGVLAMFGQYVKGKVPASEVAEAIAAEVPSK